MRILARQKKARIMLIISSQQARRIAVQASGLHNSQPFGKGKQAVLKAVQQIGYVQIDTISVVQRAHHHVIWSRVPSYEARLLSELQADDKLIFEYWSHAAAYLPIEDFRYTLPLKDWYRRRKDPWPKAPEKLMAEVYDRLQAEGPLMARDFEGKKKHKGEGWWDWKPAKLALERLFFQGDIAIVGRQGFQKIYDITERFLPSHINTQAPSPEEYAQYLIDNSIRSFGLARASEISYLRRGMSKVVQAVLLANVEAGKLVACQIGKADKSTHYTKPDLLEQSSYRVNRQLRFLSPFDNMLIQRKRAKELFDFDYQIECYVPKAKRVYGYFSLPILYGDQLIGRLDAKADRKTKTLHLQHLHFEEETKLDDRLIMEFKKGMEAFLRFNECTAMVVHKISPATYKDPLDKVFQNFS